MSFEWFVASRYLRARGRSRFRSLITALAVGGVSVGVAAAIIVLGVMNGFSTEVRSRIAGTNGHIQLLDPNEQGLADVEGIQQKVRGIDGVVATSPFVFGEILLTSDRDSEGAILRGFDPAREGDVTDVPKGFTPADASVDPQPLADGTSLPGIILGVNLAAKLRAGIGDTVTATVPDARRRGIPRMRSFVVTGLFESGIYEFDQATSLTSLEAARDALDLGDRTTGILVRVDDMDAAPAIADRIMASVESPRVWANNWISQNHQLFLWMKIEKMIGYLVFAIILTVAAFLIASTLIMIVLEKTREIGILMSIGAGRDGVRRVFLLEGIAIGGLGTAIGCALGALACFVLDHYRLNLPGDVYFVETLPVQLWWGDVVMVCGLALVICLVSALYPSWSASRLVPVEAIRYE
ncbi:MAG: ABC transporter permease [Cyanobacteria bacterium HKST-UBA02]|nr:ABC transporter permease [Gemmatimonadota bacterium]MCA9800616.1 ABC transporter permease [Cyanobacteria bacterium HKST-UBA02]